MDYRTALDLLTQVHYKPGWTLTPLSQPWGQRTNKLEVQLEAWVPDSADYPLHRKRSLAGGVFGIDLDHVNTPAEFYRIVLNNIIAWETHEAREFFRITPTFQAPWHPHRGDGNRLWETVQPAPEATMYLAA